MPLRLQALKPAVLLLAYSGATQQIPQRPQDLEPSLSPAAPSGSQSGGWKLGRGLGAGMCDAQLRGTLHPGCRTGMALLFLVLPVISFFFWHIYFLASCLCMCELCLGVWGEKEKHTEWVAPDRKVSLWKREYKQPSCIRNFLDLHHHGQGAPRLQMALLGEVTLVQPQAGSV